MAYLWTIISEMRALDKLSEKLKSTQDVIKATAEQTKACAEFLNQYAEKSLMSMTLNVARDSPTLLTSLVQ